MIKKRLRSGFLIIIASVVLVTAVAIAVSVNSAWVSAETLQRTEDTLVESAKFQAQTFETICDNKFELLDGIAASVAAQGSLDDMPARVAYLDRITNSSTFAHVFIDLPDGSAYGENGMRTQVADRSYFQQALLGKSTVIKVGDAKIAGDQRLIFAVPLVQDDKVVAAMHGSFDQEAIRQLLTSNVYGGESYSFICDAGGNIIMQSESNNMLSWDGKDFFSFSEEVRLSSGYTREWLEAELTSGNTGFFSYEMDGQKRYAVYTPLELNTSDGTQWLIFNVVSAQVISGEISDSSRNSVILIGILLVASVLAIVLVLLDAYRERVTRDAENELLHRREQQYRIVVEQSNKNIYRYDIATKTTHRDSTLSDYFGYPEVIENVPDSQMKSDLVAEESKDEYIDFFAKIRAGESPVEMLTHMKALNGDMRWFRSEATTIFDTGGKPLEAIIAYWDVTEEYERELEYQRQAVEQVEMQTRLRTDPLTGALNRQVFEEQVEALLHASAESVQHAFIMIDIDDFKVINDTYGHIVGDEALKGVATSIKGLLREEDLVGRLGGDEFMICLKNIPADEVIEKRIWLICDSLHIALNEDMNTSASLGIAMYPRDGKTFLELYNHADIAMYQAKQTGRDQYVFYDPQENVE